MNNVVTLDRDCHIEEAKSQIDLWREMYKGDPVSILTIAHSPGESPIISYFGRTLSKVEMLGILSHLSHVVMSND